jgi:hypothetical protein
MEDPRQKPGWTFPEWGAVALFACVAIQMFANTASLIGIFNLTGGLRPLFSMETLDIVSAALAWLPLRGIGVSAVFVFGALGLCYWQWLSVVQSEDREGAIGAGEHLVRVT